MRNETRKKSTWTILLILFVAISSPCRGTEGDDDPKETGPIECREGYRAMRNFAESYGKAHNLRVILVGRPFDLYPKSLFGLWMADFSPKTLEAGRELAVNFLDAFWAEIQKNQKTISMFEYYCKIEPKWYSPPMKLTHVTIKIAFWDKEVDRPKSPNLSEIIFYDNKFYYYQADPTTEALRLTHEETLEQAQTQKTTNTQEKATLNSNVASSA